MFIQYIAFFRNIMSERNNLYINEKSIYAQIETKWRKQK